MLPVLTFATGLIAGIVGVQLLKKAKGQDGTPASARLDKAQTGLRQAAVCGLAAMEKSSASLRAKIAPAEAAAEATVEATADAAPAEPTPMDAAPAATDHDAPAPARERDA